jgi:hypothetical protein
MTFRDTKMTFKALYLPLSRNPPEDKGGFETEEAAWEWVFDNCMCKDCKDELKAYRNGVKSDEENGYFVSSFPACACEWFVEDEDGE